MADLASIRLAALTWVMAGGAALCFGQAYTPPPPPLTTLPPCPVPKDANAAKKIAKRKDCDPTNHPVPAAASGPAAEQFPYPGETTAKPAEPSAAQSFPYPGDPAASAPAGAAARDSADDPGRANPNVPHDPTAEKKAVDTPAGKAFPYPGDPAPASSSSTPNAASSSSSSADDEGPDAKKRPTANSSSDDDDDQPQLTDKGSEGRRNKKTIKPQTDNERVDEDLSVAKFYGESGNSVGAYLRAKDAVKTEPEFAEAHFVLAEAAKRLKKTDEARAELSQYLKLAPDGEHAKSAEKTLAELK